MWLFAVIAVGIVALGAYGAGALSPRLRWRAIAPSGTCRARRRTVYLTYDDGPNPTTTPDLLDVLAREGVHATFFLIDAHITEETAPIVRRIFAEGMRSAFIRHSRSYMLMSPATLARTLTEAADRIEQLAGTRPCRAFRPHAGMARRADVRRARADRLSADWLGLDAVGLQLDAPAHGGQHLPAHLAPRLAGDIVVIHDGDESAPRRDQRHAVDATARLIPALRARGFSFGTVCRNDG